MTHFRRFMPFLIGLLVLAACEGGLGGEPRIVATLPPSSSGGSIDSMSDADIAAVMTLGSELWIDNCAECHGSMGEGTERGAPLPDLTNLSDERILMSISDGVGDEMPGFADDFSAEELTAAMTFARMMSQARATGMIPSPDATEDAVDSAAVVEPIATADPDATEEPRVLGVVTGQISSGTAGAVIPEGLEVSLHVLTSETAEETFTTLADAQANYRFEGVPFDATYAYVVTTPYGGIQFVSEIVSADPAAPELVLPLVIYETTNDPSVLTITANSVQIIALQSTLQVIQILSLTNSSDRAFLDVTAGESVRVRAPAGASFGTPMSTRYGMSADGAVTYDTRPVMPGREHLMHVAYTMPYSSGMSVTQSFDYRAEGTFDAIVGTNGLTIGGDGVADLGPVSTGSGTMMSFGGTLNRDAGSAFAYTVSGTPEGIISGSTETAAGSASPIAYVLIGAGVSALLIAGFLAIRERATTNKPQVQPAAPTATGKTAITTLMEEITELDAQHQAGKVSARDYQTKRAELKAQLSQLMNSQK